MAPMEYNLRCERLQIVYKLAVARAKAYRRWPSIEADQQAAYPIEVVETDGSRVKMKHIYLPKNTCRTIDSQRHTLYAIIVSDLHVNEAVMRLHWVTL